MNTLPPVHQIVRMLGRHKAMLAIILLQTALTCAILCNALDVIALRIDRFTKPSGFQEQSLIRVTPSLARDGSIASVAEDVAALRAQSNVSSVSGVISGPLISDSMTLAQASSLESTPETPATMVTIYGGDDRLVPTLGIRLLAGRNIHADEVRTGAAGPESADQQPVALVSASVAKRLYPGKQALGQLIRARGDRPARIIGVYADVYVDEMMLGELGIADNTGSIIIPMTASPKQVTNYLVRVDADANLGRLAASITQLQRSDGRTPLADSVRTFAELRSKHYEKDIAMAWLLGTIMVALLAINAFGIVGLASFWVQQRTRQIGIRRALGATRGQILLHFQIENLLIVSGGIAAGMLLAYGLNQLLMDRYELPRLSWHYLPIGAAILWALGQIAVLGPALRAASVPPATATRSA